MTGSVVFLLSPANCSGKRGRILLKSRRFPLAIQLAESGAPLGEVFAFMSSLYFRGKLAYAGAFASPPEGWSGALVIAPGRGLMPADEIINHSDLMGMSKVPVDHRHEPFVSPLLRDAVRLEKVIGRDGQVVLLGSVATDKYTTPLLQVFGNRLLFPPAFVGRGDMSRGGLMLRCARAGTPLEYAPVSGATRHGARPPKLATLAGGKGEERPQG